jgi:hypothetical protein
MSLAPPRVGRARGTDAASPDTESLIVAISGCAAGTRTRCPVDASPSHGQCRAAKRATAALVRTPWVTLTHASAACSTAG